MRQVGWKRVDAVAVTLDIIAPVTAGLLAMLSVPILFTFGLQAAMPPGIKANTLCEYSSLVSADNPSLLVHPFKVFAYLASCAVLYIYPGLFVIAACIRLYTALRGLSSSWAQQIRDSEFLVEMQLQNLDLTSPEDTSLSTVSSDDIAIE